MKNVLLDIEKRIANIRLGPSTQEIYNEAQKRRIPVLRIGSESVLQLGYGKYQKRKILIDFLDILFMKIVYQTYKNPY